MNWQAATQKELYTVLQDPQARPIDRIEATEEILRRSRPTWGLAQYKIREVPKRA